MNRAELQQLARDRIADAKVLLAGHRWLAAYYLAGYAVECALKACIAKLTMPEEFPDKGLADRCWTHDLEKLVGVAGLKEERDRDVKADPTLGGNWGIVKCWNESSRYARRTNKEATELFAAITDTKHGVLLWIKLRW